MSGQKKIPINRINKWFSQEDFSLEVEMGREALEGDGNFVVILYRVDIDNTASDDLYAEAGKDEIRFFPPVELRVTPTLNLPDNRSFNTNGSLRYLEDGPFTFELYEAQLLELDVDITYGDYVGYPVSETEVRYFTVSNDGKKNYNNEHTIIGYKGAYRTIECVPADPSEFRGV